jgi:hypothetical protein
MDKRGERLPFACPPWPPRPQAPRARTRRVPRRSDRGTSVESSSSNGHARDRYSRSSAATLSDIRATDGQRNEGNVFPSLVRRGHHVHKYHMHVLDACFGAQTADHDVPRTGRVRTGDPTCQCGGAGEVRFGGLVPVTPLCGEELDRIRERSKVGQRPGDGYEHCNWYL